MIKKYLKNRNGVALVLVITTFAILSILGFALISRALSETRDVAYQEKKMQAHYIARSGADAVAANLLVNLDSTLLTKLESNPNSPYVTTPNTIGGGTFTTSTRINNGVITIDSIGKVQTTTFGDVTSKVTLTLFNMQDRAIIAVGNYDLSKLKGLTGDVESTAGVISGEPGPLGWIPQGEKFNNTGRILPPVNVPNLDHYGDTDPPGEFEVPNNTELPIEPNKEYSKITVNNGGTLLIDTNGFPDGVEIVTGELKVLEQIKIIGPNRVFFFITKPYLPDNTESTFKTSSSYDNTADQLFIFLANGVKLNIETGGRDFNGYIYGPNSIVNLGSGAVVNGSIVGEIFSAYGNPVVRHVPLLVTPKNYEFYTSGMSRYRIGYWK